MGMKTPLTMTTSIKLGMGPRCVVLALMALTLLADRAFGQGPAKTTIADIVYRADGSPAAGTLLVTWPDFNTADNKTVAAGTLSATIGNGGAVSLALVPNQGASPAGTYYKVVFQLNDGSSSTEYWVVPSASPTTITAIRSQIVPASVAAQLASRAYVDGQVAAKADLTAVVQKAGDTMTGPLVLSGAPTTDNQAATKSYVDSHTASTPGEIIVDGVVFTTIQAAITAAGANGTVLIPSIYAGTDTYTNPYGILIVDTRNRAFAANNLEQIRFAKSFSGADLGAQINAADADLGATAGEIWVIGGGNIATQVTLSSDHTLRLFEGTITNALGNRVPAIRMKDHTSLIGSSKQSILQESSNAANTQPVIVCAYSADSICFTGLAAQNTDVHISGIHFQAANPNIGTSLLGAVTLGNCVICSVTDSWFDGIKSSHVEIGGNTTSGFFADKFEVSRDYFSGENNCSVCIINGQNINIHDNYWSAHGSLSAAAAIDLEPNTSAAYLQLIDIHNNQFDESAAGTTVFCVTVQGTLGANAGRIKIHDNFCGGGPLTAYGTAANHLTQCFTLGSGIIDAEVYNNVCQLASQPGIQAVNAVRPIIRDNIVVCNGNTSGVAIGLSGNVTNARVERNWLKWDNTCGTTQPFVYQSQLMGEQGSGNSGNVFRDNIAKGVILNGTNSHAISNTMTDGSGLTYRTPVGTTAGVAGSLQLVPTGAPTGLLITPGSVSSGCTLSPQQTWYYKVTAVTGLGESAPSSEVSGTFGGASNCPRLLWNQVIGATSYKIYRGAASGAEGLVGTQADGTTLYIDLGSAAGAAPPSADSTAVFGGAEGAAPAGIAASDLLWPDAAGHCWKINNNNGTSGCVGSLAIALTARSFLYADAAPQIASTAAAANGELLIGSTGNVPAKATLAGTANNITVTNGAGSITLSLPANITTGSYSSASTNPAASGVLRLANADAIKVRNSLNTADLTAVSADSTGVVLGDATGGATMYGQLTMTNASVNVTGSGIVSTPSLTLAGDGATAQSRMAWGAFLPGALTSIWTGAQFTPKKAVTIAQIEARSKTGPTGCSTFPVIQLTDGTTNVNTTFNAAAVTNSISGGQNYAANAVLQVKVSTAAAGCTTNPADVNVTVQYKMQ
jgi:hypothetical protein